MSTIDRSKFKATSIKAQEEKDKEVEYLTKNSSNGGGVNRLKLEDGTNKFRIYPGNPNVEGSTTMESKVVNFLPYDKPEKNDAGEYIKDKNGNQVTKRTVKGIFNSKVHGGLKYDLVESYIEIANKIAKENFESEAEQKKFLFPIYGNGKSVKGIQPKMTSVVYADKHEGSKVEFGEFEFTKAVKIGYNKIAAAESVNDPLGSDSCFTDLEEGRLLIVIKDSKAEKPQDYYNTSIDSEQEMVTLANGLKGKVLKTYPLSDQQLEAFLSAPPLANYRNCFKRRDFELQIKGLEIFDAENNLGICETEEFLKIIQLIDSELPSEDDANNLNETTDKVTPESTDPYAFLNTFNKVELKKFIADEGLEIAVKIVDSENAIREKIKEAIELIENGGSKTTDQNSDTEDFANNKSESDVEQDELPLKASDDKAARLAALKNKMGK